MECVYSKKFNRAAENHHPLNKGLAQAAEP